MTAPEAVHIGRDDLPYIDIGDGSKLYGANINLDAEGNITSVVDGPMTLEFYLAVCADLGLPPPNVLVD